MLLVFDLDGTLYEAKAVYFRVAYRLLSELGIDVPDEETLLRYTGRNLSEFFRNVLPDGMDMTAARERYIKLVREETSSGGHLFSGVYEMIDGLYSDGHEIYICSNSPEEYIRFVLDSNGLTTFISGYLSAERMRSKAELIAGLIKPGIPAIVIGDTHGDIEAAHENGLPAIAAAYGYGNKEMLATAEYMANSPEEIVDYIRRIIAADKHHPPSNG